MSFPFLRNSERSRFRAPIDRGAGDAGNSAEFIHAEANAGMCGAAVLRFWRAGEYSRDLMGRSSDWVGSVSMGRTRQKNRVQTQRLSLDSRWGSEMLYREGCLERRKNRRARDAAFVHNDPHRRLALHSLLPHQPLDAAVISICSTRRR